ncbi:MAG: MBOAT family protein [Bacteroidales bacterium]|jgi:D-alanyl-lipoteichoic acid acyltransferase DltB (MBOAT superfamily)|nr:MBOAT family protein [Bacteroidales bacterium]
MNGNLITQFLSNLFSFDEKYPLLFTQFNFWAFFAVIFTLFALLKNKRVLRNGFLFFVSLLFYYKTCGLFVILLILSTIYGFFVCLKMEKVEQPGRRKIYMIGGVVLNLLVLFYFKYAYFFTEIYNSMTHSQFQVVNWLAQWTNNFTGSQRFDAEKILLPVGISFFTFQNISYIVDVYRKKVQAVHNILDFGFYTAFFPQLVAGPIIRANEFVPQIYKKYFLSKRQFGIAVFWILNGLLKKIILSDYLAVNFVDRVFNYPLLFTPFENLSALFMYSLQVYADFSGYTDIAIGVAMLMGFYLPINFNSPYKATNPGAFWKRWHISLSTWLKDYLYIPMGGNRNATVGTYLCIGLIALTALFLSHNIVVTCLIIGLAILLICLILFVPKTKKKITTNINLMNTMLLGGIWHGASWNFMIWGGLNGVGILSFKFWRNRTSMQKVGITALLFLLFLTLTIANGIPVFRIGVVWTGILFAGTLIETFVNYLRHGKPIKAGVRAWSIFLTFVFITFTRLFFRSGSNLNPAEANSVAWNTAKSMINQIGSSWRLDLSPKILLEYRYVFILFVLGMLIHWVPTNFKRKYRLTFASLPMWLQGTIAVITIFILYQFVTADMQPFIYFQF